MRNSFYISSIPQTQHLLIRNPKTFFLLAELIKKEQHLHCYGKVQQTNMRAREEQSGGKVKIGLRCDAWVSCGRQREYYRVLLPRYGKANSFKEPDCMWMHRVWKQWKLAAYLLSLLQSFALRHMLTSCWHPKWLYVSARCCLKTHIYTQQPCKYSS